MRMHSVRSWLISIGVTLVLTVAAWRLGVALAQEPAPGAADIPAAAAVSSQINYQGELTESGMPVTGSRDMVFRLYQDSGCVTQLLPDISRPGVSVNNGHFSVYLDFNPNFFNGQELWLRAQVGAALLDCQIILPVPYALNLRPGARLVADSQGPSFGQAIFNIDNTTPAWLSYPSFYVRAASGSAVRGESGGVGVYGTSTWTYGVQGMSTNGTGGYFTGTGYGIWAATTGTHHWDHGGYFTSVWGNGVYAVSTHNYGLRAKGDTQGGVYGESDSGDGVIGSSSTGNGVQAWGNGQGRYQAALDAENWNTNGGQAAYVFNNSQWANAHFQNNGSGEVLYLVNGGTGAAGTGGGDFINARNNNESDVQFRVATDGNAYSDESFNGGGADFAEMLPAVPGLEPGDVLAIGADGRLTRSNAARQTSVAGVYSTRPGFVGGQPVDQDVPGAVPLAVVGVVPVKVSAENGPIHPGDLLVSSSAPGHAMKAGPDPAVGTVIGKAMGSLETGTGTLSALIMLQ